MRNSAAVRFETQNVSSVNPDTLQSPCTLPPKAFIRRSYLMLFGWDVSNMVRKMCWHGADLMMDNQGGIQLPIGVEIIVSMNADK